MVMAENRATKPVKKARKGTMSKRKNKENPVRIVIKHRGTLGKYGYHGVKAMSAIDRRAALRRAAADLGWLYLVRKLNALYVFNKIRFPDLAARFKADRLFASARHAATKSPKKRP